MKKLGIAAIICAVAFLGLIISGGICFGAGIANLAADSDIIEMVHTYGDDFASMLQNTQDHASFDGSESYQIHSDYEAIELSGLAGDITVVPSTAGVGAYTVLVEYNGLFDSIGSDGNHFKFEDDGRTLTISPVNDLTSGFHIGVFNVPDAGEITIYLPMRTELSVPMELDLTITDTVGEINVNGLSFGDISLKNTVGEISFENVRGNMFTCENTIGEISADGSFNGITISDTIGDCDIESETPLTLDSSIRGNIAEVNVSLPAGSQYNFTTSETLGDTTIDNELKGGSDVDFIISDSIGNVIVEAD